MRVVMHGFDLDDTERFHEWDGPVPRPGDIIQLDGHEWHVGRALHNLKEGVVYVLAERRHQ
jgi:hypothetical protein